MCIKSHKLLSCRLACKKMEFDSHYEALGDVLYTQARKNIDLKILFRDIGCIMQKYYSYFSTKSYVAGTQKNCFNETVLLSTQNILRRFF